MNLNSSRHINGMKVGRDWIGSSSSFILSYPVFKAVGVPALFAAQVDEEVCGSGSVLRGHVPHDAEGITGHLTYLDIAGGRKCCIHFCHLPLNREIKGDS